jgi:3-oxoacyl-[acyl-carrier protein] reductase
MSGRMKGQVALVTGGATGIGRAIALSYAGEGAKVAVAYSRSSKEAEETLRELQAAGAQALAVRADVAKQGDVDRLFARILEEMGPVRILVNNAGRTHFIPYQSLDEITDEVWDEVMSVNLMGAFRCARAAAGHMRPAGGGCIVNVASIAGLTGKCSSIPYAVSKAGLIGLTKSLAVALAPGIRVNAVAPGIVVSRWTEGRDEFKERGVRETPMGRNATVDDVAEVVLGLTVAAGFVTGQTFVVDGGRTI